jgi:hypothetical protein
VSTAELAARLRARPAGDGRWTARCPSHADRSPSLSIREGGGGRVLLHCFSGCRPEAVLAAMGLSWRDISGAPSTPAERVAAVRERDARQHADAAARQRDRATVDLLAGADDVLTRLARQAMVAPPGPDGDALAAMYHKEMDAVRAAEGADPWA